MTAREGNMGNCHPTKTNVNLGFASVDISFRTRGDNLISHVTLSCNLGEGVSPNIQPSRISTEITSRAVNIYIFYHATSQWIMRSDTHLSFWHNVKKSCTMPITCRFHVSDVVIDLLYFILAAFQVPAIVV